MSQYKFVLFLVVSLVFFIIHRISFKPHKVQRQQFDAVGTITRINDNDYGRQWYYVDIVINGEVCSAQTDTYVSVPADTKIGDRVSVRYRYTDHNKVRCYITQEGFQRVISDDVKDTRFFLYSAVVSLAIFLVMLVKMLFSG